MDFFADSQWENGHVYPLGTSPPHDGIDPDLSDAAPAPSEHDGHDHIRQHSEHSLRPVHSHHSEHSNHAQHVQPRDLQPQSMSPQDAQVQYHELLLNDEFYSPQLSLHNTPILSPHALTPLPASAAQDFTMPPAAAPSTMTPHRRTSGASGKITKQSPPVRWRSSSMPDDDFRLGDPAMEEPISVATIMDLAPRPQEDLEERLRNAIAATSASSRSSSRRTSSVGSSSTRVTPRIRPRVGSTSNDPSPLLAPNTPSGSANGLGDDVDHAFLKSNYRNLMDGTHKHLGFTSAERMTTELRAKKTVHKLAEQERRNRMNVAITELSGVMGPHADNSGPSKAATVERATQYIRKLQARIGDLEQKLAVLQKNDYTEESPKSR